MLFNSFLTTSSFCLKINKYNNICLSLNKKYFYFCIFHTLFLYLCFYFQIILYIHFVLALVSFFHYLGNTILLVLAMFSYFNDNKSCCYSFNLVIFFKWSTFFSFKSELFIIFIASTLFMYQKQIQYIFFFIRNNCTIITTHNFLSYNLQPSVHPFVICWTC